MSYVHITIMIGANHVLLDMNGIAIPFFPELSEMLLYMSRSSYSKLEGRTSDRQVTSI